jgi:hypothetical protein
VIITLPPHKKTKIRNHIKCKMFVGQEYYVKRKNVQVLAETFHKTIKNNITAEQWENSI